MNQEIIKPTLNLVDGDSPVLHRAAMGVAETEFGSLGPVVDRMFEIIEETNGVGLAAPQIGVSRRFFVIRYGGLDIVVINPEIIDRGKDFDVEWEGCLSYPGTRVPVKRNTAIKVQFAGLDGKRTKRWMRGTIARILQHEYDHIDGITILDRAWNWK